MAAKPEDCKQTARISPAGVPGVETNASGSGTWERLVEAVAAIEPEAQIILYGPRARGDAPPGSDWNLLILVDGPLDYDRKTALRRRIYEVELEVDESLSPMIYSRQDWRSSPYRAMPLHQQVEREGIPLKSTDGKVSIPPPSSPRPADLGPATADRPARDLRERIKSAVRRVEPEAEIILYGSRARGDARPDSDWDLLILVDGTLDEDRKEVICRRIYEVEWSQDEVLCPMVRSRGEWDSPLYRKMPFYQNVMRDRVVL